MDDGHFAVASSFKVASNLYEHDQETGGSLDGVWVGTYTLILDVLRGYFQSNEALPDL